MIKSNARVDFLSEEFGSYASLLVGNYIPNGYLIRKNIFEKIGVFTKEAPLEDYYLMLQISKYSKMKYIPKPLFYYRWHDSNTINQLEKMRAYDKATRHYEIKIVENLKDEAIKKTFQNYLDSFTKKYLVKIPFLFEFYKFRTIYNKYYVIKIFGLQFTLSNKKDK